MSDSEEYERGLKTCNNNGETCAPEHYSRTNILGSLRAGKRFDPNRRKMQRNKFGITAILALTLLLITPFSPFQIARVRANPPPTLIAFQSGVAQPYIQAGSGIVSLQLVRGDALVLGITVQGGAFPAVNSITDNLGNTYNHVGQNPIIGSFEIDIWTATVTTGGSATITATLNNLVTQFVITVGQYSGVQNIGSTIFGAGGSATVIDTNNEHTAIGTSAGTHWGVGLGGASGSATMSQNTGTLRVSAVTTHGSGDVGGGLADLTGNPGAVIDPLISLSSSESYYAAMIDLIPYPPPSISFVGGVAQPFNNAKTGTVGLPLVQGDVLVIGVTVSGGAFPAVSSVSDNLGNTYNHIGQNPITGSFEIDTWKATVTAGGNAAITVTLSAKTQFVIAVAQYANVQSFGVTSFSAGEFGTVIDTNIYHTPLSTSPGTHWGVGLGGASGSATMSQNTGTLRVSAVTTHGTGDVGGGIADLTGSAGSTVDPLINLSSSESSYAAFIDLVPYPGA